MRRYWVGMLALVCAVQSVRGAESDTQASLSPAQLLEKAEGLVGAHAEDAAMVIFRDLAARRAENPAVAGRAQLRMGECLLLNYQRPNEAEPELRKVVTDFSDQNESVNWARVRLMHVCMLQKRWGEIPAIVEAVRADAKSGKATADQVTWASRYAPGGEVQNPLTPVSLAPGEVAFSPSQLVDQAEGLIAAHAEDKALAVLREAVKGRSQDPVAAAKAQLRLGECLLANYRRPQEAEAEFRKVLSDSADQPEQVNWARLGLLRICAIQERWGEAPAFVGAIEADAQAGKVRADQMAWLLLVKGYAEEAASRIAERQSAKDDALSHRAQAMDAYMRVLDAGQGSAVEGEAVKRLVDLLAETHAYGEAEQTRNSEKLQQAKIYAAMALTRSPQSTPVVGEGVEQGETRGRRAASLVRLAKLAEQTRNGEEALAWHRMVLAVSDRSPEQEREASDAVAKALMAQGRSAEVEQWWLYLLNPETHEDPTKPIVVSLFGLSPEIKAAGAAETAADRQVALGNLYISQKRFSQAQDRFAQALLAAGTDRERGAALTGLAISKRWLENKEAALQLAQQAAEAWLQYLGSVQTEGDAHYGIEKAAESYLRIGYPDQAIAFLEQLIRTSPAAQTPSRACFARYLLVQAYQAQQRVSEAKALAQETIDLFVDHPFAQGHDWLCGHLMVRLAFMHVRDRDYATAMKLIDDVEKRWPGQFGGKAAVYRSSIQKMQGNPPATR